MLLAMQQHVSIGGLDHVAVRLELLAGLGGAAASAAARRDPAQVMTIQA
jgi:hypothetical protein